ncbi:MAG: hypothetical protein ACOX2R_07625 [Anaerolineae bacterium]
MDSAEGTNLREALWRERFHAEPTCVDRSPQEVRNQMETVWDPGRLLLAQLASLPPGLIAFWLSVPRGHVIFTHEPSRYVPGVQRWGVRMWEAVCYLRVADLLEDGQAAFLVLAGFYDHLLGSDAALDGGRFSEGHGARPPLVEAAQRYVRAEALGYGHQELGATSPGDYFCVCLWLYLHDERRLNVLDPQTHRLLANTLFSARFWAEVN